MAETLDYLEGAREEADRALAIYGKSTDPLAGLVVAQVATAQALIALVERLDKLTAEGTNRNWGALRIIHT